MIFQSPLVPATLIRRYKRFLADVELADGNQIIVHCPNPGSMRACFEPGWSAMLSVSDNPRRKLRHSLELVHNGECWIGVHPARANAVVREALEDRRIPELTGYSGIQSEVRLADGSRIDFLLGDDEHGCYLEVKNVSLAEDGVYWFPDAPTKRGRKHLAHLAALSGEGQRAAVLFLIQRSDGELLRPADAIDPEFGAALRKTAAADVHLLAYRAAVSPEGIELAGAVPVDL